MEEFWVKKGLRQGDLLVSFLFLAIKKGLSDMIRKTKAQQLIFEIKVG